MFPIRDTIQTRNYSVINYALIAANIFVFLIQLNLGDGLNRFIFTYGLVPGRYSIPQIAHFFTAGQQIFSFFSYMFIHGGFWHLIGNMWFLYIFGNSVEDRLGHLRYLLFYILCGIASGLFHLIINWHSKVPTIGASGAIAGVMGAYFLLYPRARILTLIPIIIIPYFIEIPAFLFIGIWFLFQFINATGSSAHSGGIAWWAHIGGFLFGVIFLKLFMHVPELSITKNLQSKTSRDKSHRLRVINTSGSSGDPHLYGTIDITPKEARTGTRKMVNIPWGFHKRLFIVTIPPGIHNGALLKLPGMGKQIDENKRGDIYLKVLISKRQT